MIRKLFNAFLPPSSAACKTGDLVPLPAALRPKRILFVDDDPFICLLMRNIVGTKMVADLTEANTLAAARGFLAVDGEAPFDLVILDVLLTNGNGVQLYAELVAKWPQMRVLFLTGHSSEELLRRVEAVGPARVQNKVNVMGPEFMADLLEQCGIRRRSTTRSPFA